MRHMDTVLRRLREGELSDTLVDHAYHALDSYTVGFTLWQLPIIAIASDMPDLADQLMVRLPRDE